MCSVRCIIIIDHTVKKGHGNFTIFQQFYQFSVILLKNGKIAKNSVKLLSIGKITEKLAKLPKIGKVIKNKWNCQILIKSICVILLTNFTK